MAQPIGTSGITPASKPAKLPPPPPTGGLGGLGRSLGGMATAVGHASNKAAARVWTPPKGGGSDAATSGPGYGSARATQFKQTPAYKQAVTAVFNAQPAPQKAAVIRGLLRTPVAQWTPEAHAIHDAWMNLGVDEKVALTHYLPHGGGFDVGNALRGAFNFLLPQQFQANPYQDHNAGRQILNAAEGAVGKAIDAVPVGNSLNAVQASNANQAGMSSNLGPKVLHNALKDAVNYFVEPLPSIAQVVSDTVRNPKQGLADVLAEPKAIIHDPQQAFIDHPLLAPLTAAAPIHLLTRGAAGIARGVAPKSAIGRAVSTQREGVHLTGKLTHERPLYSPYPLIKMSQVSWEHSKFERGPSGELIPKSRQLRARLIRKGVAEIVSAQERVRRVNRDALRVAKDKAIRPSFAARTVHGAKTTFAYDPARAAIPGASAFQRVADLTVRSQKTFVGDLTKHRDQVAATRPDLLGRPDLLKEHDAYVAGLQKLIEHPPKNLKPLFDAVAQHAHDYPQAEAAAAHFGHYQDMTPHDLQRASLMHYARTHMGARMDPEKGLVDPAGKSLSNGAILAHINGPHGTGGRMPTYASDRPPANSAYYVSSEHRPLPVSHKNTLFAYTHGLTDPTHEGALSQHLELQGIIDAYRSQNERLDTLTLQKPDGGHWGSYDAAKADGKPMGLVPINLAKPFHPAEPLRKSLEDVHPATVVEEAHRRSLDMADRLAPDSTSTRWGLVDPLVIKALREQQGLISPDITRRAIRGLNNQFRATALGTSVKHIPGVAAENVVRDISYGVGFRSWITQRRLLSRAEQIKPGSTLELRARYAGGQVAGATDFARTHTTAEHYIGTNVYPVLHNFERLMRAPGPRQLRTTWGAYSHWTINTTKHILEEQHQLAGVGKLALREHGYVEAYKLNGILGAAKRVMGLHGQMLDNAAKGLFDPRKERQYRAGVKQMYGNWTDLTPTAKTLLMYSPFGMWWVNSVRYLARIPVDQPVKAGVLASATVGTDKARQANGLDLFGPNPQPLYKQGGIPVGGKILAQNYYSPWGVANDPFQTGGSLIEPWAQSLILSSLGLDYLGRKLKDPSIIGRIKAIVDATAASFAPTYTKAKQLAEGTPPGKVFSPVKTYSTGSAGGAGSTSLLNSIGSGTSGVDLQQSVGDGVSGVDLGRSVQP